MVLEILIPRGSRHVNRQSLEKIEPDRQQGPIIRLKTRVHQPLALWTGDQAPKETLLPKNRKQLSLERRWLLRTMRTSPN
jgi:hypothetical protein